MNARTGENLVLVSAIGVTGTEVLKVALTDQTYNARLFVGAGITFTIIAGFASFAPQVAGVFAATILVTVMLTDGALVIGKLMGAHPSPIPHPHTGGKTK